MRKPTAVVCGAGGRGRVYGNYALSHPDEIEIVAVAEPTDARRVQFARQHGIPGERQFRDWKQLLALGKIADGAIIATMDRLHLEPAIALMKLGYDLLLEKPMDVTLDGSIEIARTARCLQRKVLVAHVLRYTPFFQKIRDLLKSGAIGQLMNVEHRESIGYYHMAHSFVRGNWRSRKTAAPLIVAKTCHDMDILYWIIGRRCLEVFSFGQLSFFTRSNQPEGSAGRCVDCKVEAGCPYSAMKIYQGRSEKWLLESITHDTSGAGKEKALRGPYGRCVFACDNDVVDHQVVSMRFEGDVLVNFTVTAFTNEITREIRLFGTEGEIRGDIAKGEIELARFGESPEIISITAGSSGHNGGDDRLMRDFTRMLVTDYFPVASATDSLESHLMAFAAETSRLKKKVIDLDAWRKRARGSQVTV